VPHDVPVCWAQEDEDRLERIKNRKIERIFLYEFVLSSDSCGNFNFLFPLIYKALLNLNISKMKKQI